MSGSIGISRHGHVGVVELSRPQYNFMDVGLVRELCDAFEQLDADTDCRSMVLAAQGKAFCAGANFAAATDDSRGGAALVAEDLYREALRLFRVEKPIVAAVHGAVIGGGVGLALAADFRVTCAQAVWSVNFARLGFHAGFGLTCTLPALVGMQQATLLMYTGRRIHGDEAVGMGLADLLVDSADVRTRAMTLAHEIADSAPLAVQSMRRTVRRGLVDRVQAAAEREAFEQRWQRLTADHCEGVAAMNQRRKPNFTGK